MGQGVRIGGKSKVEIGYFDVLLSGNLSETTYDMTQIDGYKSIVALIPSILTGATSTSVVEGGSETQIIAGGVVVSYEAGASTAVLNREAYRLAYGNYSVYTRFYYVKE